MYSAMTWDSSEVTYCRRVFSSDEAVESLVRRGSCNRCNRYYSHIMNIVFLNNFVKEKIIFYIFVFITYEGPPIGLGRSWPFLQVRKHGKTFFAVSATRDLNFESNRVRPSWRPHLWLLYDRHRQPLGSHHRKPSTDKGWRRKIVSGRSLMTFYGEACMNHVEEGKAFFMAF